LYIQSMIHIRTAKFRELETIVDFQHKMAWETEKLELNKEIVFKGVEAVFEDKSKGTYYVAVNEDEKVLGCLLTTPEWSEWRNGTVLWIQSVFVEKEHRGKGIYRQMYEYLKEHVEADEDLMGLRLYVEKENKAAQKVYTKLGMSCDHYDFYEWMKDF